MESVDSAGTICIRHKLVDVTPPGLLRVVACRRLESCQDGREKRRGRRRRAGLQQVVSLLLGQTERTRDLVTNTSVQFRRETVRRDLPGRAVVDVQLSSAVDVN